MLLGSLQQELESTILTAAQEMDLIKKEWTPKFRQLATSRCLQHWMDTLLRFWTPLQRQRNAMASIADVLEDWPDIRQPKRYRHATGAAAENKRKTPATGDAIDFMEAVLQQHTNADVDDFLAEPVTQLVHKLEEQRQKLVFAADVAEKRKALMFQAIRIDTSRWMQQLLARASVDITVLQSLDADEEVKRTQCRAVDELQQEFEAKLVREVLDQHDVYRSGFQELHGLMVKHWTTYVYDALNAKIAALATFTDKIRSQVLTYEPWMATPLNAELLSKLGKILPAEENEKRPVTIADAVVKSLGWFEQAGM
jgi:hypothetical protein